MHAHPYFVHILTMLQDVTPLPICDLLNMMLACKSLFHSHLSNIISQFCAFRQPEPPFKFQWHNPYLFVKASHCKHLPINLQQLKFQDSFNEKITSLPCPLTHLTFERRFNWHVDSLPPSITHLSFGARFNQSVNTLPSSLLHLTFGSKFNQPVNNLPSSLTHLIFGVNCNQPVNTLPSSLTHLTFCVYFNQPVNTLPPSLTYLKLGHFFNQPVDSYFRDNIQSPRRLSSILSSLLYPWSRLQAPSQLSSPFSIASQQSSTVISLIIVVPQTFSLIFP